MATADTYVRARIDSETKERATAALDAMGLSVSDAIRLLLRRVAEERRLPFEVKVPSPGSRRPADTPPTVPPTAAPPASPAPPAPLIAQTALPLIDATAAPLASTGDRRPAEGDKYLDFIAPAPRRPKGSEGDRFADLAALMADLKPTSPDEGEDA